MCMMHKKQKKLTLMDVLRLLLETSILFGKWSKEAEGKNWEDFINLPMTEYLLQCLSLFTPKLMHLFFTEKSIVHANNKNY